MAIGTAATFGLWNEDRESTGMGPATPEGDDRRSSPTAAHRDMQELLRDGRTGMLICGTTIAAVTVGFALEEPLTRSALHEGAASAVCAVLLIALAVSMIRTVILMIAAGSPLVDELGELRRRTGAPVDPAAPWTSAGGSAGPFPMSGWEHARAVLAAAHFRSVRIHQGLTWASITVACFFAWTVAAMVIG